MHLESVGTPAMWAGFTLFILSLLIIDLRMHREERVIPTREALGWTSIWVSLALLFNLLIWFAFGSRPALEFFTGYLIEEALSVDNLFVFLVIFSYFRVPLVLQHRVLFWGILGALVLRALFIVIGAALLQHLHWLIYVFGAFLVFTGIKLAFQKESNVDPGESVVLRLFRRFVPTVSGYRGNRFTVLEAGCRYATPLLMVLVVVEATDIVFAVDSIPAIFAITSDPFIAYTSNIFAVLGLRALFFVLVGLLGGFHYLSIGLGLVLSFVGVKMLLSKYMHVPIGVSLGVIALLLGSSIAASLLWPKRDIEGKT